MDVSDVLTIVGLVIGFILGQLGVVRYLLTKMAEETLKRESADDALNERVTRVKDEYVRRDDLMQHITRMESSLERLHNRIDQFISAGTPQEGGKR